MRSVKEISGAMLLVLYKLQRENPTSLGTAEIIFDLRGNKLQVRMDKKLKQYFQQITDSDNDTYNSVKYLLDKGFIARTKTRGIMGGEFIYGPYVTALGIDIIEGVDRKENNTQKEFGVTFNFNLESLVKIEPTLKAQFGLVNL